MPVQKNIVTITEWFARQQKCFEYADKVFLYRTLYLARDLTVNTRSKRGA